MERRRFIASLGLAAAGAAAALGSRPVFSQTGDLAPLIEEATGGAPAREGRVKLDLPILADNGNSVPMKVTVDSPMTAADHVKRVLLLSERNPVRNMASFYLGPGSGRAEIVSRVRLAGSQRIVALAEMSDGTYWYATASITVTLSACVDES